MTTTPETTCSCSDFDESRRRFLAGVGAAGAAGIASSVLGDTFRQVAFGAGSNSNVLVVLSLRGGADGLSMVVPHGDPAYYSARPSIALRKDQLIGIDGMFGLHPRFAPLLPMWRDGRFAAVHSVGLPQPNRSHFLAMEAVEDADPGSSERRGWINRLVGLDGNASPGQAVQLGASMIPGSLYGPAPVLGLSRLKDVRLSGSYSTKAGRRVNRSLHRTWDGVRGSLGEGVRSAIRTAETMAEVGTSQVRPRNDAKYPAGDLGTTLAETAALIRAGVGTRIVTVDYGNWDMHTRVGDLALGSMKDMVDELARALAAFFTDLGGLGSRVTVVTISEFGRRVEENDDRGLDHGYGNCMLVLGGGVRGGNVYGTWPGLGQTRRVDGDLGVTLDYRGVLSEVLQSRFPDVDATKVFPDYPLEKRVGLMA